MTIQPGTTKNHENRPGSRSWFETVGQSDHFSWQTHRQNLPIIYRCGVNFPQHYHHFHCVYCWIGLPMGAGVLHLWCSWWFLFFNSKEQDLRPKSRSGLKCAWVKPEAAGCRTSGLFPTLPRNHPCCWAVQQSHWHKSQDAKKSSQSVLFICGRPFYITGQDILGGRW